MFIHSYRVWRFLREMKKSDERIKARRFKFGFRYFKEPLMFMIESFPGSTWTYAHREVYKYRNLW